LLALAQAHGGQFRVQPAGNRGFDVYANGVLLAPIRLAANGVIVADSVVSNATGLVLSGLRATDPLAITFATNDFVSVTLPTPASVPATGPSCSTSRSRPRIVPFWFTNAISGTRAGYYRLTIGP
jgi:hypothetical protein